MFCHRFKCTCVGAKLVRPRKRREIVLSEPLLLSYKLYIMLQRAETRHGMVNETCNFLN